MAVIDICTIDILSVIQLIFSSEINISIIILDLLFFLYSQSYGKLL